MEISLAWSSSTTSVVPVARTASAIAFARRGPGRERRAKQSGLGLREAQVCGADRTQARPRVIGVVVAAHRGELVFHRHRECGQRRVAHRLQKLVATPEMPVGGIGNDARAPRRFAQHHRIGAAVARERDTGIEFDQWDMPKVDTTTMASTHPKVFFGGDAAFGPKNIIWAVAHGHEAAVSIDKMLNGEDISDRPMPAVEVMSQKMGIHEWSYDNEIALDKRYKVPHRDKVIALKDIKAEVELGFDEKLAFAEAGRCLNCDVQTVFSAQLCIECDACVDICPMDCITFTPNGEEADLRKRLSAPAHNLTQDLYVQDGLKTGRVMVKDEDVCLHCGLCAERCPTGAWDMQKFLLDMTHAGTSCRPPRRSAA